MSQYPFAMLVLVIPLLTCILIPVLGLWKKKIGFPLVLIAITFSFISSLKVLNKVLTEGHIRYFLGGWDPPWGIEIYMDHLNALMLVLVTSISVLVAIYTKKSIEKEHPQKLSYFYTLFLLLFTGLVGIVITGDMFNLYVFLEIASLSAYALICIGEDRAPIAAFRYVVLGTIGACFYLLGVGYLYISTGSLNMQDLVKLLPELYQSKTILVALVLFIIGISIKMGFFPLHVWLPDAYTYAPSSVSSFMAPLMTKVSAYVMIRVLYTVFQPQLSIEMLPITTIISWLAFIAILFGSLMALAQKDFKRMLTYIIVAEVGYIALGIGMANKNGLTGAILHIVNDAFMMACLFFIIGAIYYKTGTRNVYQFRHLNKKMPYTMFAFIIVGLSVVGIPPTCGFFSKWYLLLGAIDLNQWMFAAALLFSSLTSAVLFFRVVENAFLNPQTGHGHGHGDHEEEIPRAEAPMSMLVPIFATVVGIMLIGPMSNKIISLIIQHAIPAGF